MIRSAALKETRYIVEDVSEFGRVAVMLGGDSSEREVSLDTGAALRSIRSRSLVWQVARLFGLPNRARILDFGGGMAAQQVANMRPGDVLVAIAFAEYAAPVVDVVREAHLRGVTVLAITDTSSSPLARNSTVVFYVDDETTEQFRPIAGAIGLVHTFIISLGSQSGSRVRSGFPRR